MFIFVRFFLQDNGLIAYIYFIPDSKTYSVVTSFYCHVANTFCVLTINLFTFLSYSCFVQFSWQWYDSIGQILLNQRYVCAFLSRIKTFKKYYSIFSTIVSYIHVKTFFSSDCNSRKLPPTKSIRHTMLVQILAELI